MNLVFKIFLEEIEFQYYFKKNTVSNHACSTTIKFRFNQNIYRVHETKILKKKRLSQTQN